MYNYTLCCTSSATPLSLLRAPQPTTYNRSIYPIHFHDRVSDPLLPPPPPGSHSPPTPPFATFPHSSAAVCLLRWPPFGVSVPCPSGSGERLVSMGCALSVERNSDSRLSIAGSKPVKVARGRMLLGGGAGGGPPARCPMMAPLGTRVYFRKRKEKKKEKKYGLWPAGSDPFRFRCLRSIH